MMARHDYIFVDESGDPGYACDPKSGELLSSGFYIAAALHLSDDAFAGLNKHMAAFRYYSGLNRELKVPPSREEFTRLLGPIKLMAESGANIRASVVYLDKCKYNGRYLKPRGLRLPDPHKFRNYVLFRLLRHHFYRSGLYSNQYELIVDRFESTGRQRERLARYLSQTDKFPMPAHITHAASIYVEGLQAVHHIANGFKGLANGEEPPSELSFVSARNLTSRA